MFVLAKSANLSLYVDDNQIYAVWDQDEQITPEQDKEADDLLDLLVANCKGRA